MAHKVGFLLVFVAAASAGCGIRNPQPEIAKPVNVVHTVQYEGETLGRISEWYTGSFSKWKLIAGKNPKLSPTNLQLGQKIVIPASLVMRRAEMPKSRLPEPVKTVKSDSSQSASLQPEVPQLSAPQLLPSQSAAPQVAAPQVVTPEVVTPQPAEEKASAQGSSPESIVCRAQQCSRSGRLTQGDPEQNSNLTDAKNSSLEAAAKLSNGV